MSDVRIEDHSDEYMREVDAALERAMEAIGVHMEGEAKEELSNSPRRIDTGLLRNSITYAIDGHGAARSTYTADTGGESGSYGGTAPKENNGHSVMIGTNVEYGIYVHEGHSTPSGGTVAPNRFLKNTVERNKDQINDYIKNAMS